MRTRTRIDDDAIAACLHDNYGVLASGVERLWLGHDAEAAVFRVDATDGRAYFLKLKLGMPPEACVVVPRFLREASIQQVVAPLPTRTPAPWGIIGDFTALLYPYVPGRAGSVRGLTLDQWSELGAALARIHALRVPVEVARMVPREQFIPSPRWSAVVRAVLAGEHRACRQDEPARELSAFLAERQGEIRALLDREEALGRMLQRRPAQLVLCHADIHVNNVLIDESERVHIVDWDQPVLAPRECDLMLVVGPAIGGFVVGSGEEAAFFAAYGEVEIDPVAMAFYRYERSTSDIGAYAYEVYWMPDAGEESRREAVWRLKSMFQPGRSVEAAYDSEADLPA